MPWLPWLVGGDFFGGIEKKGVREQFVFDLLKVPEVTMVLSLVYFFTVENTVHFITSSHVHVCDVWLGILRYG